MKYIAAVALVFAVFVFYWLEIRPNSVRQACLQQARTMARSAIEAEQNVQNAGLPITKQVDYDKLLNDRYRNCMLEHGFETQQQL